MGLFARLVEAVQVEFHGEYSDSRLAAISQYCESASATRVAAVIVATPLPCLLIVVALDLVPLKAPEAGNLENWAFWLRHFWLINIATLSILVLIHRAIRSPVVAIRRVILAVLVISACATAASIGIAELVGFPVPFCTLTTSIPWALLFYPSIVLTWGSHFRQHPICKTSVVEYMKVLSNVTIMLLLCPLYIFVFRRLPPLQQALFSVVLPTIKLIVKNIASRQFRVLSDFRPEEIIFSIELFASLFLTFSIQNSSSLLPAVIPTAIDVAQACASLYDINHIVTELARTRARIKALQSAQNAASARLVAPNLPPSNSTSPTYKQVEGLLREITRLRSLPTSREINKAVSSRQKAAKRALLAHRVGVATLYSSRTIRANSVVPLTVCVEDQRPTSSPPNPSKSGKSELEQQQTLFTQQALRLLHVTEYVVLVELVEVIIPVIYLMYLSVITHLPNRQFYPQLVDIDSEQYMRLVTNVGVYAMVELSTLLVFNYIIWRRLRFSLFTQLAFVLDTQWRTVQAKVVLWVAYVVQGMLVHYGADYSFQFAWLRRRSQTT